MRTASCAQAWLPASSASRSVPGLQELALQHGCIHLLVEQTHSTDAEMRLSAVWALQNLAYQAGPAVHQSLMDKLPWQHAVALLSDSDRRVQVSQLAWQQMYFWGQQHQWCWSTQTGGDRGASHASGPVYPAYPAHVSSGAAQPSAGLSCDPDRQVPGSQLTWQPLVVRVLYAQQLCWSGHQPRVMLGCDPDRKVTLPPISCWALTVFSSGQACSSARQGGLAPGPMQRRTVHLQLSCCTLAAQPVRECATLVCVPK